jgi:hypothetical protein
MVIAYILLGTICMEETEGGESFAFGLLIAWAEISSWYSIAQSTDKLHKAFVGITNKKV